MRLRRVSGSGPPRGLLQALNSEAAAKVAVDAAPGGAAVRP